MTLLALLRLMPVLALLVFAGGTREQSQGEREAPPALPASSERSASPAAETVLQARNKVLLELGRKPVALSMTIRSFSTGHRLLGEVSFTLSGEDKLEPTDDLTCVPSLTLGCGVVARFASAGKNPGTPTVFEAVLEDGTFWIRDDPGKAAAGESRNFENFVESVIDNGSVAIRLRVDQQEDFVFDLRRISWPLADFPPDHPFAQRFGADPVLTALKRKFPARYLKVMHVAREILPDAGALEPAAETRILEAVHAAVGSLRPMVPDELLEKIVVNADAAARQVGARDPALCNALAVAARSSLTTAELKDTPLAKEEHELWRQVVETANPRFLRKVSNAELLPSTPRFEENMRQANASGCGMFAAVIEAILKLPRDERRLWLRATVGTVEDMRQETGPRRG